MTLKKRIFTCLMAILMLLPIGATNVYAAGHDVVPLNAWHDIGDFTFSNTNTTPYKTSTGRYLTLGFMMQRSTSDRGVATTPIRVEIKILDYSTGRQIGSTQTMYLPTSTSLGTNSSFEWDLGYSGRKFCIFFESFSYNGPTNGNYRTVYVDYTSYSSNTAHVYV